MLCLGTFLQLIIDCSNMNQKEIVGLILNNIDFSFDDTNDSLISDIVRCVKNPPKKISEKLKWMEKEQYSEITEIFSNVVQYIIPNKVHDLKQGLRKLIQDDKTIRGSTIVDLVNEVDKDHMPENEKTLESILSGLFIYVMKYTSNTINRKGRKKAAANMSASVQTASSDNKSDDSDIPEDVYRAAQDFCLKHEKELGLLPLCQIAFNIDPLHNNVRSMYTDFIRCPQKVREAILQIKEIPQFTFAKDWVDKAIDHYKSLVDQYELSTREFLYDGAKYLHRAYFNYSAVEVTNPNPFIFDPPCKLPERYFIKEYSTSVGGYIRDYLWYKQKDPSHNVKPPMDYLWDLCHLGNCDEPELTFWVCRFIISSSFQFRDDSWNVEAFWDSVHIDEELLKTQEDMYYYALLQLYLLTLNPDDLPDYEE